MQVPVDATLLVGSLCRRSRETQSQEGAEGRMDMVSNDCLCSSYNLHSGTPSELLDSSTMCQGVHHQILGVDTRNITRPYCNKCSTYLASY